MNKRDRMTYKESVEKIEELIAKIENPATQLEEITGEVKKALELIKYCKDTIKGFADESALLLGKQDGRA
ncbi:MAG: exodeoxyribonuclease VII small subunit [Bacteroidia bacterium]|jgi:exodeoxyribonuclease VII small subunit|nr:exodeoxyribonuclease VII small subunit [Bacteroidia bacterium]